ncbi:MAG TPA: 50S ribosomal protein L21 [Lutibacter sp.]|nr:50S ribosomal protein L21 [Lutibacter sp.]
MYAIVEIAGQQFKVAKDQKVFVHRLAGNEGDKVSFDKVLLLDDGKITIGAPAIKGAGVTAKILGHLKGDKVIVFKKKRRKGYQKKNGHRQFFTEIQITSIAASGHKASETAKPKTVKATPEKEAAKPKAKKVAAKPAVKKETAKKVAPKKATAKKTATKADDLKKVEGIGPKIASIFVEAGIDTFAKLAKADVKKLQEILATAGPRYASKNPGSWPKQAKMAAEGKWDELNEWQDNVKGGIE